MPASRKRSGNKNGQGNSSGQNNNGGNVNGGNNNGGNNNFKNNNPGNNSSAKSNNRQTNANRRNQPNNSNNNNSNNHGNNTQEWCDNCGWHFHDTNNCRRHKGSILCQFCGKYGHAQLHCPLDPNSKNYKKQPGTTNGTNNSTRNVSNAGFPGSPMNVDPGPQFGPVIYCSFCNSLDHSEKLCSNYDAKSAYHNSVLRCQRCKVRAHTTVECKNPAGHMCLNCQQVGHHEWQCRKQALARDSRDTYRAWLAERALNASRLWTGGQGAMQLRQELNAFKQQQAASGVPITPRTNLAHEKTIANRAAEEMFGRRNLRSPSARPSMSTSSPKAFGLGASILKPNRRASGFRFDPAVILKMQNSGVPMDAIKALEKSQQQIFEDSKTDQDIALERKINASRCYRYAHVGAAIRAQENFIFEHQLLTRKRFDEIKMELARGTNFWRDPSAIERLVKRQRPRCNGCKTEGMIFDRHFCGLSAIISEEEILRLDDGPVWGLFVGLPCPCSFTVGYSWINVPQSVLFELQQEEDRKQQAGHV